MDSAPLPETAQKPNRVSLKDMSSAVEANKDKIWADGTTICGADATYQPSADRVNATAKMRAIKVTPGAEEALNAAQQGNNAASDRLRSETGLTARGAIRDQIDGFVATEEQINKDAGSAVISVCRPHKTSPAP